jgi:aspartyl-tRNA(Asn)/glutamyl-tRNA(Gln) amidotransferase subunit B
LGTIKAIEDAVIAERDRQIAVIESGGAVEMETRGWTLGGKETYRLRGKEGEVDYRYMPDPDIPPLWIGEDLVRFLGETLPMLPGEEAARLEGEYGLTPRDAAALLALDDGRRVEYFYRVAARAAADVDTDEERRQWNRLVANWALHELGRLTAERAPKALTSAVLSSDDAFPDPSSLTFTRDGECARVPTAFLASLLTHLFRRRITAAVAKSLLIDAFDGAIPLGGDDVTATIEARGLWFKGLTEAECAALAERALEGQEAIVEEIFSDGAGEGARGKGKLGFLVGRAMRLAPRGSVEAGELEKAVRLAISQWWEARKQ